MATSENSLFENAYSPFLQTGIVLGLSILVHIGAKVVNVLGIMEVGGKFHWMTAAAFLLFFAVFNSVFSLSSKDSNKYWLQSILCFCALAIVASMIAYFLSSIPINDAGSYRWIFIVVGVGYLVFLSMVGFMKRIVDFAQREEWNQPRMKNRTKKRRR